MIMAAPFPNGCPQLEHSFFPLTDLQEGKRQKDNNVEQQNRLQVMQRSRSSSGAVRKN